MFCGQRDHLLHLESMILGYAMNASVHRRWDEFKEFDLLPFGKWLVTQKGFSGPDDFRWSEIILRQFPDEKEAYERFFELLQEYRGWPEFKMREITPVSGTSEAGRYC